MQKLVQGKGRGSHSPPPSSTRDNPPGELAGAQCEGACVVDAQAPPHRVVVCGLDLQPNTGN